MHPECCLGVVAAGDQLNGCQEGGNPSDLKVQRGWNGPGRAGRVGKIKVGRAFPGPSTQVRPSLATQNARGGGKGVWEGLERSGRVSPILLGTKRSMFRLPLSTYACFVTGHGT